MSNNTASEKIIFPKFSNKTYRQGFIKLMAYVDKDSNIDETAKNYLVDFQKDSNKLQMFTGSCSAYLENLRKNVRATKVYTTENLIFQCILPLPLNISDQVSAEWNNTNSAFIEGLYGKFKNSNALQSSVVTSLGNMVGQDKLNDFKDAANTFKQTASGYLTSGVNYQNSFKTFLNNTKLGQAYQKSFKTSGLLNGSTDVLSLYNNARAINGARQVIFDPGYWQQYQGTSPRSFTLMWEIIPENRSDAIVGLALCARLKELALPIAKSVVELESPPYWKLEFVPHVLDTQTFYNALVLTNVDITYAQNGEYHADGTPKMFRINLSFIEAKAPTANVFMKNYNGGNSELENGSDDGNGVYNEN